jgi:hypothetical protein
MSTPIEYSGAAATPTVTAPSYVPDQLIVSDGPLGLVTQPIELLAGTLPRGAVLGQVSSSAVIVTAGEANVGTGMVGTITPGATVQFGAPYMLTATSPTAFFVTDPEGNAIGTAIVGTAFSNAEIAFTITAGGTAFAVGDVFTLLAPDVVGSFIASVRTASDGSQVPVAILADDADASGGPVKAGAYITGEFDGRRLTYDPTWTLPVLTTALRSALIFVKLPSAGLSAADPT